MPFVGVLRSWNDDRGFGFIAPTHGGAELFVHISAFPRDGTRPTVGEKLSYELASGKDGKPQAVRVIRAAIGNKSRTSRTASERRPQTSSWIGLLFLIVFLLGGVAFGYNRYTAHERRLALESSPVLPAPSPTENGIAGGFRCDGRTMCSQMTSCAEAKWFINNCPGTRMDGNHDGTPCEQQWCTSPFAK